MQTRLWKNNNRHNLLFKSPRIWILTLFFNTLNFLITYNLSRVEIDHLYFYLADFFTTYLIIRFFDFGIELLNKKLPLEDDFVKRVKYQLTLHTLAVVVFTILINELLDNILFGGVRLSLSFEFYTQDMILAVVFILLIHAIYFGLYLLSVNAENPLSTSKINNNQIKVIDGGGFKLLVPETVLCIYTSHGTTYVLSEDFKKYTSHQPLKKFIGVLTPKFFRANRQFIISKSIIDSYKSSDYGKIELRLKENGFIDLPNSITVSRERAALFRAWVKHK